MATRGVSLTVVYIAWDTTSNAGKTGDAANHTLRWIKDGTAAAPTNSPVEVDATNAPGAYKLTLTAAECDCNIGWLAGKSSTSGVSLMPVKVEFERLPDAAPGGAGGVPTVDASNRIAGIQGSKTTLDALNDVSASQVWSHATRTLTAFGFSVTVSTNNDKTGYTLTPDYDRAKDALRASEYTAPDNVSIASILNTTNKFVFDTSNQVAAYIAPSTIWSHENRTLTSFGFPVTVGTNNDKTGYTLTPAYDRAKDALVVGEYQAPDNAGIAAIKAQTDKLSFDTSNRVRAAMMTPTTGDIADAVWDEPVAEHTTSGSTGAVLAAAGSGSVDYGTMASAVWSHATRTLTAFGFSVTVGVNNDKTGYTLTSDYDRAKTALANTEYTPPDNAGVAAIKSQTDKLTFDGSNRVVANTAVNQDKTGYALTPDYDRAKDALKVTEYQAPDNTTIGAISTKADAIKAKTDKLTFDASNRVFAACDGGGGGGGGGSMQVIVQPLSVRVFEPTGDGGMITMWRYARARAAWYIDSDLRLSELVWIAYSQTDPNVAVSQCTRAASEITVEWQDTYSRSYVSLDAAEAKVPAPGTYRYVLRDQTTDTVLLSGTLVVRAAPDAA